MKVPPPPPASLLLPIEGATKGRKWDEAKAETQAEAETVPSVLID